MFKQSVRIGRVAGIPVGLHWSVLVIVSLIAGILGGQVLPSLVPGAGAVAYWLVALLGALLFVVALLAHELAHAVVARRKGVPVTSITLWALGGVAELGGEPSNARSDLQIAAAGPATSLAAALVFAGLAVALRAAGGADIGVAALAWLAAMNVLLAVFNLLPGAPLDGGRILRAAIWWRTGDRARAAQAAAHAGRIIGALLVGLGVAEVLLWRDAGGLWMLVIGIFLVSAASSEAAAEAAAYALGGLTVRDVMTPDPATGAGWLTVEDFIHRVALHTAQSVFPVVGFDGSLLGFVGLDLLSRIPPPRRQAMLLREAAMTVPPAYRASPDDPAAALLTRPPLARELSAIVLTDGRIVGMVTADHLSQVVRRARLRPLPLHPEPGLTVQQARRLPGN